MQRFAKVVRAHWAQAIEVDELLPLVQELASKDRSSEEAWEAVKDIDKDGTGMVVRVYV